MLVGSVVNVVVDNSQLVLDFGNVLRDLLAFQWREIAIFNAPAKYIHQKHIVNEMSQWGRSTTNVAAAC